MRMIETTEFPVTLTMGSKTVDGEKRTVVQIVRRGETTGTQTVLDLEIQEWEHLVSEARRLRGSFATPVAAKCSAESCAKAATMTIGGVPYCDEHGKAARKAA